MTWMAWRWGFWVRLGREGRGFGVVNHNQHAPLFSERYGVGGRRYLHIGPWCLRTLPRLAPVREGTE